MSRYHSYLHTTQKIIENYDGRVPLSYWLKDFFRQHKQMGSRDRKTVADLAFGYYRLGRAAEDLELQERILTGFFLSNQSDNEVLMHLRPEWHDAIRLSLAEKAKLCHLLADRVFPWQDELSPDVDAELFTESFFCQPDVFLRIRPGHHDTVHRKLSDAGLPYQNVSADCLAFRNSTKLDVILELDREAVIQDYNSQRVGNFISFPTSVAEPARLWDCCAASGGKSIMACDLEPRTRLTVSDIRASILENLHKRFDRAGIINYDSFVADLGSGRAALKNQTHIIADLPCSGSGTWSRTPEQLRFFNPEKIRHYSNLQKRILSNVLPALVPGGQLVYVTCSVFKKENEDVAKWLNETGQVKLTRMELLKGYALKADSMFVAAFEKE